MNFLVAVAEAVKILVAMIVPSVVPTVERRLFCFDFGMKKSLWLPRCCCCFGYEKETETEGEGK